MLKTEYKTKFFLCDNHLTIVAKSNYNNFEDLKQCVYNLKYERGQQFSYGNVEVFSLLKDDIRYYRAQFSLKLRHYFSEMSYFEDAKFESPMVLELMNPDKESLSSIISIYKFDEIRNIYVYFYNFNYKALE